MSNAKVYQIIPSDVCFSCDVCCRFLDSDSLLSPIFTREEKQRLLLLGSDVTLFRQREDGLSSQIALKQHEDYFVCPFFETETNKCSIYANRPLDCQLYPFSLMYNVDRTEVVLGVDMLCPYSEKYFETETFQNRLQTIIDFIETDEVKTILETHWSLIGAYQDTVKVFHTLSQDLSHATPPFNP